MHTGWDEKLPFAFWKLYIGKIRDKLDLYLARTILRHFRIHTEYLWGREEFGAWW
jgi:hypothetical protein